jgi:hypothetical protein
MNLKIGTKQLLGYLGLLALTGFLGLFALLGLGTVREQAAELAERSFPLTQALSELRPGLFQYRVSEIDYVFTQDPNKRDLRNSKMQNGLTDSGDCPWKNPTPIEHPGRKENRPGDKSGLREMRGRDQRGVGTGGSEERSGGTIDAIRGDAKEAIEAISRVGGIIAQVDIISTAMASAVKQQSASTDQMSSSLTGATKSSRGVAENIRSVKRITQITSDGTVDLQKAAAELSQTSADLHSLVSQFRLAEKEPSATT